MSLLKTIILSTIFSLAQFISAQLTSESVAMRPCYRRTPFPNGNPVFAYNPLTDWHIKYGSRHFFRSYAEAFLGRSPENEDELDAMNLKSVFTAALMTNMGYGTGFFQQVCVPSLRALNLGTILGGGVTGALIQANCTTVHDTASFNGPFLKALNPTDETVIWTDNKSVLVVSRCVGSGAAASEDWKIVSNTPTLSPDLLSSIIRNLTKMGFDTTGY